MSVIRYTCGLKFAVIFSVTRLLLVKIALKGIDCRIVSANVRVKTEKGFG